MFAGPPASAEKRPLIQVAFSWRESDPKDKPFTATNGGDDEARNVRIGLLHIGHRTFTFTRIGQLLPGASTTLAPREENSASSIFFRTLIDGIEQAIDDRARELKAALTRVGTPLDQFAEAFDAEKAAREEFERIPLTVTFEDPHGRRTILQYCLTTYVFARLHRADLEFVHEVRLTTRPSPFPPLRATADDAGQALLVKRDEGAHLFDNDKRFTSEMQERFFNWLTTTGDQLKQLFWSDDVSNWFHTGTGRGWSVNDFRGLHETRDDRLEVLDQIIASFATASPTPTPTPTPATGGNFQYDVCLSFAGEQRDYVDRVAEALRSKGVRVFYDKYEQANLWGKDLYEHLNGVYSDRSRYCVFFISKEYAAKQWTSHERKSAQSRAFRENREYILPARFDSTEIPGLNETVGYIDLRDHTPDQFADLIIKKLADDAPSSSASSATTTASDQSADMRRQLEELQRTIDQLQQRDAPRTVSDEQAVVLLAELSHIEPQRTGIFSLGDDSEADRFRDQLGEIFRRAGWPVQVRTAVAAMGMQGLSLDYFTGHSTLPPTAPPGEDTLRLKSALERAGLKVRTRPIQENENNFHWMLTVGRKPRL